MRKKGWLGFVIAGGVGFVLGWFAKNKVGAEGGIKDIFKKANVESNDTEQ
jgi:hypothetical protein